MAESIVKDLKGKADWVYVGRAEPARKAEKKPDTLFQTYMRDVFDIAAPVAHAEMDDAVQTQAKLAEETLKLAQQPAVPTDSVDTNAFLKRWVELDTKVSTPDVPNRLGKILTGLAYMGGSFAVNMGSEKFASVLYRNRDDIPFFKKTITPNEESGNKRMLDAGWEYLTDYGIEEAVNMSVKKIVNRQEVGFVSPLAKALSKIGNTIFAVTSGHGKDQPVVWKSITNPGFIEGFFRAAGAIPNAGFIRAFYGRANDQIMKGEGIVPMGADLALNMMLAKLAVSQKPSST